MATNTAKKREDEIKTKINISAKRTESSRGKSAVKKHTANAAGKTFVCICCGDFNFELIKKGLVNGQWKSHYCYDSQGAK